LLTGYLGGATVTHLRVGDPFFAPILLGVVIWGGLFLREPRVRALIPLRTLAGTGHRAVFEKYLADVPNVPLTENDRLE
jgi:hypothetical protein